MLCFTPAPFDALLFPVAVIARLLGVALFVLVALLVAAAFESFEGAIAARDWRRGLWLL